MEDVSELISKVSRELGPDASDEEISERVLEAIEAMPESDRAQVLEQVVKGVSSGRLRHLDKEVGLTVKQREVRACRMAKTPHNRSGDHWPHGWLAHPGRE